MRSKTKRNLRDNILQLQALGNRFAYCAFKILAWIFCRYSAEQFCWNLLVDLLDVKFLVGDDFRFGRRPSGCLPICQKEGEKCHFDVASNPEVLE